MRKPRELWGNKIKRWQWFGDEEGIYFCGYILTLKHAKIVHRWLGRAIVYLEILPKKRKKRKK